EAREEAHRLVAGIEDERVGALALFVENFRTHGLLRGKGDRAEERKLRLARIEARVLHHDRLWIAQVVEAHMARALRGNGDAVGSGRIAVAVEERDAHV